MSNDRHFNVTTHDGDKNADESGVAAILRAFVKNPGGAIQIITFIGGMYGIYYFMQGEIGELRAAQKADIVDIKNTQLASFERLNTKLEALTLNDTDERQKIEAVYARGDVRYQSIIAKLSEQDISLAKINVNQELMMKQFDKWATGEGGHKP